MSSKSNAAKKQMPRNERKRVHKLKVKNIRSLDSLSLICKTGFLVDVSESGILLHIDRNDLIPKELRENLTINLLEGKKVFFKIEEMDLEINGDIARTKHLGKGFYELALDLKNDNAEYWRQCLYDLMPDPINEN